jgi:cytochrome c biogenesis protein CcdA
MTPWNNIVGAVALGLLTALQPCALALSGGGLAWSLGWGQTPGAVVRRGFALSAGLCLAYASLAFAAARAARSFGDQATGWVLLGEPFQGPLILAAGALLCGLWFPPRTPQRLPVTARRPVVETVASLAVGLLLAGLACPPTAGVFLLLVVPAAIASQQPALYAAAFGLGAAAPLLAIVLLIGAGGRLDRGLWRLMAKAQRLAGWALVAYGAWRTVRLLVLTWR